MPDAGFLAVPVIIRKPGLGKLGGLRSGASPRPGVTDRPEFPRQATTFTVWGVIAHTLLLTKRGAGIYIPTLGRRYFI